MLPISNPKRPRRAGTARSAALALLLAGCASARPAPEARLAPQPFVVYVVRHAEKADATRDAALSEAGRARAAALAGALADAGVGAVVTTQFVRTQETAAPLARALGLEASVVAATAAVDAHAADVARSVQAARGKGAVLVVGHSNTVPAIVAALGGPRFSDLCEADFDNLFVLVLRDGEPARLTRARFGAPDDESGCEAMRPL